MPKGKNTSTRAFHLRSSGLLLLALVAARPSCWTGGGTMLRVLHLRVREPMGAAEKARLKISAKLLALAKTVLGSRERGLKCF